MLTLDEWTIQRLHQCIGWQCQCVGLVNSWADNLTAPLPLIPAAKDLIGLVIPNWVWISNDSIEVVPVPGDLIVWGTGMGPYGHVAVVVGPVDAMLGFRSLDQNWYNSGNYGSPAEFVQHPWNWVAGWFHFTEDDMTPQQDAREQNTNEAANRILSLLSWGDQTHGGGADGDPNFIRDVLPGLVAAKVSGLAGGVPAKELAAALRAAAVLLEQS